MALDIVREEADGQLVAGLLQRYYAELAARFPEGFDLERTVAAPAEELSPPNGAFLVAYLDGEAVGCGAVRTLGGRLAEIKRMWVDPVTRGHGVGRRLLAALEESARDLGCGAVRLDTNTYLAEALALYRSSGYRDIPPYNDNGYAEHWFEKELV